MSCSIRAVTGFLTPLLYVRSQIHHLNKHQSLLGNSGMCAGRGLGETLADAKQSGGYLIFSWQQTSVWRQRKLFIPNSSLSIGSYRSYRHGIPRWLESLVTSNIVPAGYPGSNYKPLPSTSPLKSLITSSRCLLFSFLFRKKSAVGLLQRQWERTNHFNIIVRSRVQFFQDVSWLELNMRLWSTSCCSVVSPLLLAQCAVPNNTDRRIVLTCLLSP